jgi:signal transduction histidine kinase
MTTNIEQDYWKILIVDDDPDIHNMTRFVLGDFSFMGKGLNFLSAYSGKEAGQLIENNPDTALILLDVVMEEDDSGLKLVTYIRETLKNDSVRIVLRTGQPGLAPQKETIEKFNINGYKEKNCITNDELYSTLISSIRSYSDKTILNTKIQAQELEIKEAVKRAEVANIAKAAFLSTISHELRTPLTSISGFLEILEERFKKILIPNLININDREIKDTINLALEEIGIISSESITLTSLINELIDLSGLNSDSMFWKWEKINIVSVFNNTAQEIKPMADKKGLYLRADQDVDNYYIWGDLERITQVVTCLLNNAVKFTDKGGIVYKIKEEADMVRCEVADTGTAIPSDKLDAIFAKFTQLSDVLTNKSKGIGLGLSISKEIINLHNGSIRAEAKVDVGNSFIFVLPVYKGNKDQMS